MQDPWKTCQPRSWAGSWYSYLGVPRDFILYNKREGKLESGGRVITRPYFQVREIEEMKSGCTNSPSPTF